MTKTELIDAIASGVDGPTRAKAEQALSMTLQAIMEPVGKDDAISLIGFGTFSQGKHAEHMVRSPRTGEETKIGATKTVKFKAGQEFKGAINA